MSNKKPEELFHGPKLWKCLFLSIDNRGNLQIIFHVLSQTVEVSATADLMIGKQGKTIIGEILRAQEKFMDIHLYVKKIGEGTTEKGV